MKAKLLLTLVMFSFFLMGCAERGNHYTVRISPWFSLDQQAKIIQGASQWETATKNTVHPISFSFEIGTADCADKSGYVGGGAWHTLCILTSSLDVNATLEEGSNHPVGVTLRTNELDSATVRIALDDPWVNGSAPYGGVVPSQDWVWHQVIAHEIGHGMGLKHHDIPGVLMNPNMENAAEGPTQDDIQQLDNLF